MLILFATWKSFTFSDSESLNRCRRRKYLLTSSADRHSIYFVKVQRTLLLDLSGKCFAILWNLRWAGSKFKTKIYLNQDFWDPARFKWVEKQNCAFWIFLKKNKQFSTAYSHAHHLLKSFIFLPLYCCCLFCSPIPITPITPVTPVNPVTLVSPVNYVNPRYIFGLGLEKTPEKKSPEVQTLLSRMRLLIPSEQLLRPRWLSASGVAGSTWGGRGRSCCSPDPGNLFERAIPELRALRLLSPPENPLSTCNRFTWNPRLASTQLRRGNWHKVGEPGSEWMLQILEVYFTCTRRLYFGNMNAYSQKVWLKEIPKCNWPALEGCINKARVTL